MHGVAANVHALHRPAGRSRLEIDHRSRNVVEPVRLDRHLAGIDDADALAPDRVELTSPHRDATGLAGDVHAVAEGMRHSDVVDDDIRAPVDRDAGLAFECGVVATVGVRAANGEIANRHAGSAQQGDLLAQPGPSRAVPARGRRDAAPVSLREQRCAVPIDRHVP